MPNKSSRPWSHGPTQTLPVPRRKELAPGAYLTSVPRLDPTIFQEGHVFVTDVIVYEQLTKQRVKKPQSARRTVAGRLQRMGSHRPACKVQCCGAKENSQRHGHHELQTSSTGLPRSRVRGPCTIRCLASCAHHKNIKVSWFTCAGLVPLRMSTCAGNGVIH